MSIKPIRIFFSPLSRRFYATAHYREGGRGEVTVTGKQYDVTNEIAALIEENNVAFVKRSAGSEDREEPDAQEDPESDSDRTLGLLNPMTAPRRGGY